MTDSAIALTLLAGLAAVLGTNGGIGGATLLVPALVAFGLEPTAAAPLGLVAVGGASLAAASRQLRRHLVHHRLGLTLELPAAAAAVTAALVSTDLPEQLLAGILAAAALVGAVSGFTRQGVRNRPDPTFVEESTGEWPGTLGGSYELDGEVVPYQAHRVGPGLFAAAVAGAVAGLSGVGGGFLKTPTLSELMHVPVRVAAATTSFTLGITASAGLAVFAGQGRIETEPAAAVLVGAVVGGSIGAVLQGRLAPPIARRVTATLLLVVAVVVVVRAW